MFTDQHLKLMEKIKCPFLEPADILNAVLYVLGPPPHVQVSANLRRLAITIIF